MAFEMADRELMDAGGHVEAEEIYRTGRSSDARIDHLSETRIWRHPTHSRKEKYGKMKEKILATCGSRLEWGGRIACP